MKLEENYRSVQDDKVYGGIPLFAPPCVHEKAADQIVRFGKKGAEVIELGCGRGAFAKRVADMGYSVDACDQFDICECKDSVRFIQSSVESLDAKHLYDIVCSIEVIEHVEDPFGFFRKCVGLLKPGGIFIFSTPNIESELSRSTFFITGAHMWFGARDLELNGHVMPLHTLQIKAMIEGVPQCELLEQITIGRPAGPRFGAVWCMWRILKLYNVFMRRPSNDELCHLVVLRKVE